MSASVNVSPGSTRTLGLSFHPSPRSRAACAPVPSVARAPAFFSPEKFSGLMLRLRASESRLRLPRCIPSPLNDDIDASARSLPLLAFGSEHELDMVADIDGPSTDELAQRVPVVLVERPRCLLEVRQIAGHCPHERARRVDAFTNLILRRLCLAGGVDQPTNGRRSAARLSAQPLPVSGKQAELSAVDAEPGTS